MSSGAVGFVVGAVVGPAVGYGLATAGGCHWGTPEMGWAMAIALAVCAVVGGLVGVEL